MPSAEIELTRIKHFAIFHQNPPTKLFEWGYYIQQIDVVCLNLNTITCPNKDISSLNKDISTNLGLARTVPQRLREEKVVGRGADQRQSGRCRWRLGEERVVGFDPQRGWAATATRGEANWRGLVFGIGAQRHRLLRRRLDLNRRRKSGDWVCVFLLLFW